MERVFQETENFISSSRGRGEGEDDKPGRKRKRKSSTASSVFTRPEWREAVIHYAENLPMDALIQEFNRFYPNFNVRKKYKRISVDKSGKTAFCNEKKKDAGEVTYLPTDVVENILLRLQLADVVASRSISHHWRAFYDSKHFQDMHDLVEKCIVINNHNLDMWAFSVISKRWFLMKVPCDWDTLGMKTLGVVGCRGLFLVV